MSLHRQFCCAALLALMLAGTSSAQSIGYWHLPSTHAQYCGFGCGPGHHVPMIRTHGCAPLRVPRCVHTRGCLSSGLAYCESFRGGFESPGCHAELDALVTPDHSGTEDSVLLPEPGDSLFSFPGESDHQVLPAPQSRPQRSPQN
ncbi:hypothetical protein Pr1d_01260 [Bythopirellula goksoeyrii]|uniref:Uncharacterized protein n=1 Tax=Bythopirellula goksoeyrii TaxID=1400387 RepID=A0A5B9Q5Q6_9BACT|nr:hypothetical protein Pr1d_01260 [Bythopirellula goksoeyrii]